MYPPKQIKLVKHLNKLIKRLLKSSIRPNRPYLSPILPKKALFWAHVLSRAMVAPRLIVGILKFRVEHLLSTALELIIPNTHDRGGWSLQGKDVSQEAPGL